ncbi:hypothetical protein I5S29_13510 [Enterococcus faecium]|nr:hypothetical protein [Enterococcus faecium]EKY7996802.1 hypothetical protein [Enterococcus faecium]MBG8097087.1 hypothetical protein [Enterococcus faecium]MBG8333276.1 hypothetical protein [Enterococcus faecium]MBH0965135.1 hypothetical protein [Enterococcus faecium]
MPKDFDIPKMMENGEFEPLLPNNKRQDVKISGEYNFSNSALSNTKKITLKKRGRPVSIPDKRNKVSVPKKISPALNSKLSILQDYMTELQSEKGRISFEKIVNTLADSYIQHRLGVAKEEHIREEIQEEFEKLPK